MILNSLRQFFSIVIDSSPVKCSRARFSVVYQSRAEGGFFSPRLFYFLEFGKLELVLYEVLFSRVQSVDMEFSRIERSAIEGRVFPAYFIYRLN